MHSPVNNKITSKKHKIGIFASALNAKSQKQKSKKVKKQHLESGCKDLFLFIELINLGLQLGDVFVQLL